MPVYEYQCAGCGRRFSKLFRSVASAGPVACPGCGHPDAERALSLFAYHASLQSQIESLDPRYEQEMDWAERRSLAPDPRGDAE